MPTYVVKVSLLKKKVEREVELEPEPEPEPKPPKCGQTDGWMDGQTRVKTLPSRRTTYAVGKYYHVKEIEEYCKK